MSSSRSYSKLITLRTFEERYNYLQVHNNVGSETFGSRRYLNQQLYSSQAWKQFRNKIIIRDDGHDLAMPYDDFIITGDIYIHHLNPITVQDIAERSSVIFDEDNVVCVSYNTHQAIHYGTFDNLVRPISVRTVNDTCPWKR